MSRPVVDKRTRWQKIKDFFFKTNDETEKFKEDDIDFIFDKTSSATV